MSDPKFLKCPCRHCGAPIEFPAHGIGMAVKCPHCAAKTTLFAPPLTAPVTPPEEIVSGTHAESVVPDEMSGPEHVEVADAAPARNSRWPIVLLLAVLILGAAGFAAMRLHRRRPAADSPGPESSSARASGTGASNALAQRLLPETNSASAAPAPKSIDELKVGSIQLEKAKGSSLVYAVGTLRNESDHQRFGIKLELELDDRNGLKVGTAKDYRAVLEPRQVWNFRALVLETKAATARVAHIREDE